MFVKKQYQKRRGGGGWKTKKELLIHPCKLAYSVAKLGGGGGGAIIDLKSERCRCYSACTD